MKPPASQSYRNEKKFLTNNVSELGRIRAGLEELGYDPQTIRGVLGWLVEKSLKVPDRSGRETRSRYRGMLRELEAFWGGPEPQRADAGYVPIELLPAVAVALGVASLFGHVPGLALAAAPIIQVM